MQNLEEARIIDTAPNSEVMAFYEPLFEAQELFTRNNISICKMMLEGAQQCVVNNASKKARSILENLDFFIERLEHDLEASDVAGFSALLYLAMGEIENAKSLITDARSYLEDFIRHIAAQSTNNQEYHSSSEIIQAHPQLKKQSEFLQKLEVACVDGSEKNIESERSLLASYVALPSETISHHSSIDAIELYNHGNLREAREIYLALIEKKCQKKMKVYLEKILKCPSVPPSPREEDRSLDYSKTSLIKKLSEIVDKEMLSEIKNLEIDLEKFIDTWLIGYTELIVGEVFNLVQMVNMEKNRHGCTKILSEQFGNHCFSRVPEHVWYAMIDDVGSEKPWGVFAFGLEDNNGLLDESQETLEGFFEQIIDTHSLIIMEVISTLMLGRYMARARQFYGPGQDDPRCSFFIINAHGVSGHLLLTRTNNGKIRPNNLKDSMFVGRIKANYLKPRMPYASLACQNGKKLIQTISEKLDIPSSGAAESSHVKFIDPIFDEAQLKIVGLRVDFAEGETVYENYSPEIEEKLRQPTSQS